MTEINVQYAASSTTRRRIAVLGLFTTNMVLTFAYIFGEVIQDFFKN
jgi:small neutral amino acid transporter SnatA (MarC family)